MQRNITTFALITSATLLLRCSMSPFAGGSDNPDFKVSGTILADVNGGPAANTRVQLLPASYNPVSDPLPADYLTTTTDKLGAYHFTVHAKGAYRITAVQNEKRTRLLISGIEVKDDLTMVVSDSLRKPGAVKIMLTDTLHRSMNYVYIPGTTVQAHLNDELDFVLLDSVPAGILPSINSGAYSPPSTNVIRYTVLVTSGNTAVVSMPAWNYAKTLYLNTTASGADVNGTVTDFPVLIRLSSATFNFAEAKTGGDDIRFTKSDGTSLLPCQIEQWDDSNARAAIWVKVDTVQGDNRTQSIMMYWGSPSATSVSNGAVVFDTSAGFKAAWHLDSSSTDATINRHNGRNYGAATAPGIIGPAQRFDGNDSIIIPGVMDSLQTLTLSAWTNLDSCEYGAEVISIGNYALLRLDDQNASTQGVKAAYWFGSNYNVIASNRYIQKTGWRYVSFAIDNALHTQTISFDGVVVAAGTFTDPISYVHVAGEHSGTTVIGRHATGAPFTFLFYGMIDEARVCSVARSSDWIKLCYMNQKEQDALVAFFK